MRKRKTATETYWKAAIFAEAKRGSSRSFKGWISICWSFLGKLTRRNLLSGYQDKTQASDISNYKPVFKRPAERLLYMKKRFFVVALPVFVAGCGHTAVHWSTRSPGTAIQGSSTFVLVSPGPALPLNTEAFENRLLAIVHERDPRAEVLHGGEPVASRVALDRGA